MLGSSSHSQRALTLDLLIPLITALKKKKLKHQPGSSESPRKAGCHPGGCCPRTFSGIGAWGIRALGS